jgi:hypothetical protein
MFAALFSPRKLQVGAVTVCTPTISMKKNNVLTTSDGRERQCRSNSTCANGRDGAEPCRVLSRRRENEMWNWQVDLADDLGRARKI